MGRRPDPWLPGAVLLVHEHEAALLLPVVEAGLREWQRMGAVSKLEAAADLLARWRHLADGPFGATAPQEPPGTAGCESARSAARS